jgi:hypothetical protein
MKHLLIGLFALAAVLGTGCTKDEAEKPKVNTIKKADAKEKDGPVGGDCPCGPCPCTTPIPK